MSRARDIKVGLFVLAGLALTGLVIFLIGDERLLFSSSVEYKTSFSDVGGLKPGAPVMMGGIDIGHVKSVGYGDNPSDATIYVTMSIVQREASRIRQDSMARIEPKGLLGDKILEITKGGDDSPPATGMEIEGEPPSDIVGRVGGMAAKAENVLKNIENASGKLANEDLHRDLRASVAGLRQVLEQVSTGEGYPHRLLSDKEEADRISNTVTNLDKASSELALTLTEVRGVIQRVKYGPGFAHSVIYGNGPQAQIEQFGNAAGEVAATLKGMRESDSLAHDILYGGKGDGAEAIANVTAITGDLKAIMHDVRAGKGTIGALLVDPSIYQDIKMLVGNVERNDVLRALVRYSIKQDEKKPSVDVASDPPEGK